MIGYTRAYLPRNRNCSPLSPITITYYVFTPTEYIISGYFSICATGFVAFVCIYIRMLCAGMFVWYQNSDVWNNCIKVSTTKICHIFIRVEQGTRNSSKNMTHFLICFSVTIHAKKPTESCYEAVKNMSKTSIKNLAKGHFTLHWRLTKISASFQAICRPLGFSKT